MRASRPYGGRGATARATTSSATSSGRTAGSSNTPRRCRRSATTTRSAAPKTGSGRRGAPTSGASRSGTTSASPPPSARTPGNNYDPDPEFLMGFALGVVPVVLLLLGFPFSAVLITAVGAIDIIIPPSIPMIVYGTAAQESVPRLYAAGVLPGLLIAAMIAVYVVWYARRHNFERGHAFSLNHFGKAFVRGIWALGAPFIILGGIYGGVFSPTEAAAVACVYAVLFTWCVFGVLGWRDVLV